MNIKKKVICLYRVSTKKQTNKEEDIPVQRKQCLEYIEKHNKFYNGEWEFYTEIVEGGVSAYHNKIEDRKIQEVLGIVKSHRGEQFVLLAFYSDRISRQDLNGFGFIDSLHKLGVEVWTVQEGQLKIDTEQDRLTLFIKFWGNNNESRKTATRVDAARKVLTEQGVWTGGTVQYGYILKPTGEVSKKGRVINDLAKEPIESAVVKEMYEMLVHKDYTLNGIMNELNSRGLKTKKGCKWNTSTIKNILKNPLNKGYLSYKKTTTKENKRQKGLDKEDWVIAKNRNPNYVIVSDEIWDMAQDILQRKARDYNSQLRPIQDRTYKSKLLLTGLLVCGHCGNTISPAVSSQWSGKKERKKIYIEYYRCNLRAKGADMCSGKTYVSAKKLEKVVLEKVYEYLDGLQQIDCSTEIEKLVTENTVEDKMVLEGLMKEYFSVKKTKEALEEELINSVMGKSPLSKENINTALDKQKIEIERLEQEIEKLKRTIQEKEISEKETLLVQKLIPVWREVFKEASVNVKKQLLSLLIEKIVVTDNVVDIYFKVSIDKFIKNFDKNGGGTKNSPAITDLYISSYEGWSPHLAHHVVAQMAALVAVGAGNAEVVIVAVWEVSGDGGKGLEPVFGDPGPGWIPGSSLFRGSLLRSGCFWRGLFQACLLFKIAHHAAQDCAVGFFIIGIIFQALCQRIHGCAVF